jgi:hypothetical protein
VLAGWRNNQVHGRLAVDANEIVYLPAARFALEIVHIAAVLNHEAVVAVSVSVATS